MRGLLGRDALGGDEGILLRPASSVHTFFMKFAIDIVFLDRGGCVLKVASAVRPWRLVGARRAKTVIELRAGRALEVDLRVGDELAY